MKEQLISITSASNPRIRQVMQLQKKRKEREATGLFAAEGIRLFGEIPSGWLEQVFVSESFLEREDAQTILEQAENCEIFSVKDSVFAGMCDTRTPQGILAVAHRRDWTLQEILKLSDRPFFMMAENLQDPGNLGTILRTGEGAGITALILSKGTVDIYSPKVIRSTMGSLFRVPFLYIEDMAETAAFLRERGIMVYGAHLEGSVPYDEPDYTHPSAILIGNEGNGLTDRTAAVCSRKVRIPMEGAVESLNAAMSAGILMYEVHRQRTAGANRNCCSRQ
ncbi:MAG: RNA methyltransferase [Lachnospiraceae bacterium]|nr:RNA methyltransferase [Lachnospiraceae bacterium]MDY4969209.1 RNA methyltransferase [Lachnospiraceae bacterium]